jgi:lactoylglutathione lyase
MPPSPLRWTYTGIRVRDVGRSVRFYKKLGFREVGRGKMDHGGVYVGLVFPGSAHELELNYYPRGNPFYSPYRPGSEFDHFGFDVDDIAAWVRRLRRGRLPIVADWTERGFRLVFTRDPDGNWLEVGGKVRTPPSRPSAKPRRPS